MRYYISDAAAASNDDVATGNIPHELSQLSSLQRLYLLKNNLSGKIFLTCHFLLKNGLKKLSTYTKSGFESNKTTQFSLQLISKVKLNYQGFKS